MDRVVYSPKMPQGVDTLFWNSPLVHILTKASLLKRSFPNPYLSLSQLKAIQAEKLDRLLKAAATRFFYRSLFEIAACPERKKFGFDDLMRLPVLERETLQKTPEESLLPRGVLVSRLITMKTSGTTGRSLDFFISRYELLERNILRARVLFFNRFGIYPRCLNIFHPRFYAMQGFDLFEMLGRCRKVSVLDSPESWLGECIAYKPDIIRGYVSALKLLARQIQKSGARSFHPKAIFVTGEFLGTKDRTFLREAFQADVFSYYSSNEIGLMAWECFEHKGLHVDMDNLIVEIIRADGSPVMAHEDGEVVVTALSSLTMPFIRYRQGDQACFLPGDCSCGCAFPLIEIKTGRRASDFYLKGNRRISYWGIKCGFESLEGLSQYRVVQKSDEHICVQLVVKDANFADAVKAEARHLSAYLFGLSTNIEIDVFSGRPDNQFEKNSIVAAPLS
jgi:phenylacetate-CoA ligase